jgi:3-hydroxybutyryl-CoA dehydratase
VEGKNISLLSIGDSASFQKTISESDIYLFAGITGDFNPVHVNEIIAKKSMFGKRIAHGMLSASLISTVLGQYLPGPGTIYLGQELRFKKPVYIGESILAEVEISEIKLQKNIVVLQTKCVNQAGVVILEGEAVVMPPLN